MKLRYALADSADTPLYIETIPKRGYRFIAPLATMGDGPAYREEVPNGARNGLTFTDSLNIGNRNEGVEPFPGDAEAAGPQSKAGAGPARETSAAKAPEGETRIPGRRWVLATVVLVMGGALVIWLWPRHQTKPLTNKDTIVLADFDNKTGDTVFDDTLKQGLSVQLGQSPFLALISERRVNETLKLMGMKALNCISGDVLAQAQEQVASKEAVLKALDDVAISMRSKLGESLISVEKYDTPLEEATTPSLEALKAYSLGRRTFYAEGETASLPFYKRAVELDPNFAIVYSAMASVYNDLNEFGLMAENQRKAYDLREKVSEREKFLIEGQRYFFVTGELEKAAQVFELWQQTYPRDDVPCRGRGVVLIRLGNWDNASEEMRQALRLEPNNVNNYVDLAASYAALDRLDETEAVLKQAEERKLEGEFLFTFRYLLAFLKGDAAQMAKSASAAMGKPGTEGLLLAAEADTEGWYGKLKSAHELTERAMDSAQRNEAKETAAGYQVQAALREVEFGNREQASVDAKAAVKLAPNRDVRAVAALALARAGDTGAAEKLAAELDKAFPLDTLVQREWLPTIRASVALERKDPNQAIELLKAARTIELGIPSNLAGALCPVYLRG
jgi:tetratricopeptide (TPR) repeat protein